MPPDEPPSEDLSSDDEPSTVDRLAGAVADALRADGRTIAVAESLTGGLLSDALARAEGSGDWFRGAVVAYSSAVKHDLLGVRPGPVVAEGAAIDMAESVARLLAADVAVAATGAGGPDPQDGQAPGTVWLAVAVGDATRTSLHHFEGDPPEVIDQSVVAALRGVLAHIG